MFSPDLNKLDNPVWYALTEKQQDLSIGTDTFRRYLKTISPFVAIPPGQKDLRDEPDQWIQPSESFYILDQLPPFPSNYKLENKIVCLQMVCQDRIPLVQPLVPIKLLGSEFDDQIVELVTTIFPGFYLRGTRLMGDYFGIFEKEKLVAISGERFRMDGLTEISAVVTHPDHTGKGYAQILIAHLVNKNLDAGIIPFLHTGETNTRAIKLYDHLGFATRRKINVWKIKRNTEIQK